MTPSRITGWDIPTAVSGTFSRATNIVPAVNASFKEVGLDTTTLIILGVIGGLIPDAIRFGKGRHKELPGYIKTWQFWVGLALMAGLGALAAWLGQAANIKEALAYGFAGPEALSRLLSVPSKGDGGGIDKGTSPPSFPDEGGAMTSVRIWWST